MKKLTLKLFSISFLLMFSANLFAQDETYEEENESRKDTSGFGFHSGFYVGSYFANKYTASMYDGYGYDFDGNRNDFVNSFMFNKIGYEYGGGNGQPDRIAQAVGVQSGEWSFGEEDMPIDLRYSPAFCVGIQSRFSFNKTTAIILNANAVKLSVNGAFTIKTINSQQVSGQATTNIKSYSIKGGEQRIILQLGYQKILGDPESKLNLFVEGGLNMTMVKFEKNYIVINSLQIDLTTYYNQYGNMAYKAKNLTGVSFGAFGGVGFNLNTGKKWTVQLLYSPSYDKIKLGEDQAYKLQNGVGFRAYYNF